LTPIVVDAGRRGAHYGAERARVASSRRETTLACDY